MVKPRQPKSSQIAEEFAGGLLPSLSQPQTPPSPQVPVTQPVPPMVRPPAPSPSQTQARRKISPYVDDPYHIDLIDALLTALRPYGVRRDLSMLIRALLNQAAQALNDPAKLEALAAECLKTPPDR